MAQAKSGDKVRLHYKASLSDGTVFGSSDGKEPLELTLGNSEVFPALEAAVIGMEEGETKTVVITPEDGFGERREDLVATVEKSEIPEHINPEVGMKLLIHSSGGGVMEVTVTEVTEGAVKLDGNHPLAGQELTFEISLVEVVPAA